MKRTLTDIMNFYGSDKGNGHHNYTDYYSLLFDDIRHKELNILEIGIGSVNPNIPSNMCGNKEYKSGSSLRGWKEYFYNSYIYGCDIDKNILFEENKICTFYLDQTNPLIIYNNIVEIDRKYDIIIDDGLHFFDVNWAVLKQIFCKLNEDGFYIIEDIINIPPYIYKDSFMDNIEFRYLQIPNEKNTADNNIAIIRNKNKKIPDLK